MEDKGLTIINIGNGKGKTTAALGLSIRSMGWGRRICFIQFLKTEDFECGEKRFFKKNKIEMYSTGIGYSWTKTIEEQKESLKKAWEFAKEKLKDENYDMVVLDEINNVLSNNKLEFSDIINEQAVIDALDRRPIKMDVVLTGRGELEKLIGYADIVTKMENIKHCYNNGNRAKKGVEF